MLNPTELRDPARRMESGYVHTPEAPAPLKLDYLPTCRECEHFVTMQDDINDQVRDAAKLDRADEITPHEWRLAIDALRMAADLRERQLADARAVAEFFG